jgi:glutamate/tyrosine decarboxylase-like PLP-dependent enzyme
MRDEVSSRQQTEQLLADTADRCLRYLESLNSRGVAPATADLEALKSLCGPLPSGPTDALDVIRDLDEIGSPATTATAGPRYFGLVIGGALPVAVAASWLTTAWDQNNGVRIGSPMAAAIEDVVLEWLRELLVIPAGAAGALVTGATMANFVGLAAARHALLARKGWDAEGMGIFGAPPLTLVVGEEVHASVLKALSMLGLGRDRALRAPVDEQGRLIVEKLPKLDDQTILCMQAGNVNTGAFDPAPEICARAKKAGSWVHVDGAFGLWAQASKSRQALASGFSEADSWSVDAHKWLNVPYDSGIAFVRDGVHLAAAMTATASYLVSSSGREPFHYTPEMSRRARAIEIWAVLRSLGKAGVAALVDKSCAQATRMASKLSRAGFRILNEVGLNQILVSFGDDDLNRRTIELIQLDGTCWCGGTEWMGRHVMRISVSSWMTTDADVDLSVVAIKRAAQQAKG